jgi:hypothetical protein
MNILSSITVVSNTEQLGVGTCLECKHDSICAFLCLVEVTYYCMLVDQIRAFFSKFSHISVPFML